VSASAPWKDFERRHAKRMGGVRLWRPDFSDSQPDGENGTDTWDTKAYARHTAVTMFVVAEKKYREFTNGRRFHLALFARDLPRAGDFVLLRAADFEELLECERRCTEFAEAFIDTAGVRPGPPNYPVELNPGFES